MAFYKFSTTDTKIIFGIAFTELSFRIFAFHWLSVLVFIILISANNTSLFLYHLGCLTKGETFIVRFHLIGNNFKH